MKQKFPKELHKKVVVGPKAGLGKNRNRIKCVHYIQESHLCQKHNIGCVGPSNPICQHYTEGIQDVVSTTCTKEHSRMLAVVNNNTTVVLEHHITKVELIVKVDSHTYESHKALLGKTTDELVEFEGKIYSICKIFDEL